jgi:hypothetical protein
MRWIVSWRGLDEEFPSVAEVMAGRRRRIA